MRENFPFLPHATQCTGFLISGNPQTLFLFLLLTINLVSFAVFGIDKRRAGKRGARRIPERTLFLLAGLGGSIGALLGMRIWHHKTLHRSFRFGIPAILAAQLLLCFFLHFILQ